MRCADDAAIFSELPVIADRDDDIAIGSGEGLVRHDIEMRIAHAARHFARDE